MTLDDLVINLHAKQYYSDQIGTYYRAKCPVHNGKTMQLWFHQDGAKMVFKCWRGCDYRAIRLAVGLGGGENIEGTVKAHVRDPIKEMIARRKILDVWENSTLIDLKSDSPVAKYLRDTRRVLTADDRCPSVLRETRQKYYDEDFNLVGEFACMVASLAISDGSIANVHRTYLTDDGLKAPVSKPKKLMTSPYSGATDGAAIRLFPKKRSEDGSLFLGIAEGIETALAVKKLSGVNCWATWCSAGMAKFNPPSDIKALNIYVDNDVAGRKSAAQLIARLHEERLDLETRLIKPPDIGQDWDNVWQQQLNEANKSQASNG